MDKWGTLEYVIGGFTLIAFLFLLYLLIRAAFSQQEDDTNVEIIDLNAPRNREARERFAPQERLNGQDWLGWGIGILAKVIFRRRVEPTQNLPQGPLGPTGLTEIQTQIPANITQQAISLYLEYLRFEENEIFRRLDRRTLVVGAVRNSRRAFYIYQNHDINTPLALVDIIQHSVTAYKNPSTD